MRKKLTQSEKNKRRPQPDERFGSGTVSKLINYVMLDGEKDVARSIVYGALDDAVKKLKKGNALEILETAIANVSPDMEVKSKRVGGANYQVPREVRPERKFTLAARWIVGAARSRKGVPIRRCLSDELIAAYSNEGEAFKKKETMHRMAEANRAFAHFA